MHIRDENSIRCHGIKAVFTIRLWTSMAFPTVCKTALWIISKYSAETECWQEISSVTKRNEETEEVVREVCPTENHLEVSWNRCCFEGNPTSVHGHTPALR